MISRVFWMAVFGDFKVIFRWQQHVGAPRLIPILSSPLRSPPTLFSLSLSANNDSLLLTYLSGCKTISCHEHAQVSPDWLEVQRWSAVPVHPGVWYTVHACFQVTRGKVENLLLALFLPVSSLATPPPPPQPTTHPSVFSFPTLNHWCIMKS